MHVNQVHYLLVCRALGTCTSLHVVKNFNLQCSVSLWRHFWRHLLIINKSNFKITKTTIFLASFWCREWDKKIGTSSGQVGPQVPSGLIYKVFVTFCKNLLLLFVSRARSRSFALLPHIFWGCWFQSINLSI